MRQITGYNRFDIPAGAHPFPGKDQLQVVNAPFDILSRVQECLMSGPVHAQDISLYIDLKKRKREGVFKVFMTTAPPHRLPDPERKS